VCFLAGHPLQGLTSSFAASSPFLHILDYYYPQREFSGVLEKLKQNSLALGQIVFETLLMVDETLSGRQDNPRYILDSRVIVFMLSSFAGIILVDNDRIQV